MKILLISKTLDPTSGIGRYSKNVYENLNATGHLTSIMVEDSGRQLYPLNSVLSFLKNLLKVRKQASHFDVLHALDAWPYGVYALCATLGTKKRFFVSGVGTYSVPPRTFSIKRFLLLALYRKVTAVFCISEYTKKRIAGRLPFKAPLYVIHLAADLLPPPKDVSTSFAIPKIIDPVFITVGAVKERKGQRDTLISLAKLKHKYPRFCYLIVGSIEDKEYVATIQSTAHELGVLGNVLFIDSAVTDVDLASLYSISDIHILNSNNHGEHFEGFGLVLLEANQFGVPGIGSRDCGIEDAILDGVSGILVPQKDHKAIADAVETIISNKEQFARGARDWYTRFSWQKTVTAYSKFYSKDL